MSAGTLSDVLTDESKKPAVITDCLTLIDEEVDAKGGLSGLALKAGYKVIKGIKPGFVQQVVTDLLPEFAAALDPLYQEAKKDSKPVSDYFSANKGRAADALLSITDAKAERAKSGVVKGTYDKLRSTAKKNVEDAIPRLGRLIAKYAN
ncbi:MAG: hypothetical protein KBF88_16150 [Polyangiaceae bacterium]|nr:hypothetical protein [Polyangiaceae bacterium]